MFRRRSFGRRFYGRTSYPRRSYGRRSYSRRGSYTGQARGRYRAAPRRFYYGGRYF